MTQVVTGRTGVRSRTVSVLRGSDDVAAVLADVDDIAARRGLSWTARGAWIAAALDVPDGAVPWAVVVHDGEELVAGAVLVDRWTDRGTVTTLATGDDHHRAGWPSLDDAAAALLAQGIADELSEEPRRVTAELGPVADGVTARTLARVLPGTNVLIAEPVPAVRRGDGDTLADYLSHGLRKTLRKAHNRMTRDGLEPSVVAVRDPAAIAALLPDMAAAHRDRDGEHGIVSSLDEDHGEALWAARVRRLADAGCVELTTLRLGGEFAAYVVGLLDAPAYRILEGCFVTRWSRYAPGRIVEAYTLRRMLLDERYTELDWMTGVAPETLIAANAVDDSLVTVTWRR